MRNEALFYQMSREKLSEIEKVEIKEPVKWKSGRGKKLGSGKCVERRSSRVDFLGVLQNRIISLGRFKCGWKINILRFSGALIRPLLIHLHLLFL